MKAEFYVMITTYYGQYSSTAMLCFLKFNFESLFPFLWAQIFLKSQ
jgi:hypothetical protein